MLDSIKNRQFNLAKILGIWLVLIGSPALYGEDVGLAWNANSETNLTGYNLHYGNASLNYTTVIPVGNQTTYTVTNLGPGTYFFAVTAVNDANLESGYSNEVSHTVSSSTSGCDINTDGGVNAVDVQVLINVILGAGTCPGNCDVNLDGSVNVIDLQSLGNVVLGASTCP